MPEKSITILHLSDLQFGANHRFGLDTGTPDAKHDTLLGRLTHDLDSLRQEGRITTCARIWPSLRAI
mgnify:CR=1 FL=1